MVETNPIHPVHSFSPSTAAPYRTAVCKWAVHSVSARQSLYLHLHLHLHLLLRFSQVLHCELLLFPLSTPNTSGLSAFNPSNNVQITR